MKKRTLVVLGLVLSMSLIVAGSAFAHWGGGYGMMGNGYGMMGYYGSGNDRGVDVQNLKKFQKETLQLRDNFITQRAELQEAYAQETPDADRIAQLRKDIIDTETAIQKIADKYDIGSFRSGGRSAGGSGNDRGCF